MKVYVMLNDGYSETEVRDELLATQPNNLARAKLIAELCEINFAVVLDALDAGRPGGKP